MRHRAVRFIVALVVLAFASPLFAAPTGVTIYSFPFDKPPAIGGEGWTLGGGEWQYGAPQGLGGDPAAAFTGDYVYGYDLTGDGKYAGGIPAYYLRTKALNCTGFKNVSLRFRRWLSVELDLWDRARIKASNDGETWTTIWENGSANIIDAEWTLVSYDISAVADGESTVYIQWEMGPTDPDFQYCGWNIDDVEILGTPATEVLAWIPYTDMTPGGEYENTLAALTSQYPSYNLTDSTTTDPATLASELQGKHVMLVMELEGASSITQEQLGADLSDVLQNFASSGGTIVVLLESGSVPYRQGFLNSSGLMSASVASMSWGGETLTVVDPSHPLVSGMPATFLAVNATGPYDLGAEADVIVEDPDGDAVVAVRRIGAGAVVLLAFDYYAYSTDTARLLANAVRYPRSSTSLLLYESGPVLDVGAEAINRLNRPYSLAVDATFNTALASQTWDLVTADAPNLWPTDGSGWQPFIDWVGAGGHALLSSWDFAGDLLPAKAAVASAFGVSSAANLDEVPDLFDWDSGVPAFDFREQVPSPIAGWTDIYWDMGVDANRLTLTDPDAIALAGFSSSPAAGEAAIVLGNSARTLINGFLWDDTNQDIDDDGIQDVTELVMNQILMLLTVPIADFEATPVECVVGDTVTFEDTTDAAVDSWDWLFGDGDSSVNQNPTHIYSNAGIYTVRLKAGNAIGDGWAVKHRLMWVGFSDVAPSHWAFHEVLECVEAGVVQGYDPFTYAPSNLVNRAQMATYMARTLAGGDAAVPAGPPTATFDDVPTDYWAYDYIEYCKANDIVQGYDAVTYAPEDIVNRAQMATYMARAVAGGDASVPAGPGTATFDDVPTDFWAYDYVEYCFAQGIVQGYDPTTYAPDVQVTRDQMAVYVSRALPLL